MRVSRRGFIGGMAAGLGIAGTSWAAAGSPDYLAAAQNPDGSFSLHGIDHAGQDIFTIPLPDRGHAAAAHPFRAEAVAFARRPGRFALVIDCIGGAVAARLESPEGRHFYGHGAFSADGTRLYTTENDWEGARGMVGVWDASDGYRRLGEFWTGGVGPHDIKRLPSGLLAIANGGIESHPDSGREDLNIATMEPNLAWADPVAGEVVRTVALPPDLHRNSIRHLAVSGDVVAFATQWQGDVAASPALLWVARDGMPSACIAPDSHARMQGYAGSIALSGDGNSLAITSPRGGLVQVFDLATGAPVRVVEAADVCGIAPLGEGFLATDGTGRLHRIDASGVAVLAQMNVAWDNHLVAL